MWACSTVVLLSFTRGKTARPSSVCSLDFRAINMLGVRMEGEREAREWGREQESEIEKRMSYDMSLVWLLLSSSAQWSLPPWESTVWTKPLMEWANGAAADRAHPTSASCHLSTGGGRGGDERTVKVEPERRKMWGREGVKENGIIKKGSLDLN